MKTSDKALAIFYIIISILLIIFSITKPNEDSGKMIFLGSIVSILSVVCLIIDIPEKKGVKEKSSQLTRVRCPECGYKWNSYYSKSKINFTICPKCKEPIYKQLAKSRKKVHHYSWNLDSR